MHFLAEGRSAMTSVAEIRERDSLSEEGSHARRIARAQGRLCFERHRAMRVERVVRPPERDAYASTGAHKLALRHARTDWLLDSFIAGEIAWEVVFPPSGIEPWSVSPYSHVVTSDVIDAVNRVRAAETEIPVRDRPCRFARWTDARRRAWSRCYAFAIAQEKEAA